MEIIDRVGHVQGSMAVDVMGILELTGFQFKAFFRFYFVCMNVLPVCMPVHHVHTRCP